MQALGTRIRMARGPHTQEWVAFKMGVTRRCVLNWENGHRMPDLESVWRLADLLGVKAGWLAFEEEPRERTPQS